MADVHREFVRTCARRVLFVAVLLLTGAATVSVYHYVQTPGTRGLSPIALFAWGFDSIHIVLAVWLVSRTDVWHSRSGLLRVAGYITAYGYGRMLFSVVQDSWVSSDATFQLPGARLDDYARPAIDLLSLLMYAWLVTPIVIAVPISLSNTSDITNRTKRFSLSGLIAFTTTAAFTLSWIRFLTSDFAPQTAYSELSQLSAIREWTGTYLPFSLPPLIAIILMLYGWTKRWSLSMLVFLGAVIADGVGTRIVASILEYMTGRQQGGILGGSPMESWLYVCGRSFAAVCAIVAAALMGVRPIIGNREPAPKKMEA